jgi:hypothetical protein
VEHHCCNILSVAPLVKGVKAHTSLVIPNLDDSEVITGDDMGFVWVAAKVYAVHAGLVSRESVVCSCFLGSNRPNFDFLVQGG